MENGANGGHDLLAAVSIELGRAQTTMKKVRSLANVLLTAHGDMIVDFTIMGSGCINRFWITSGQQKKP